MIRFLHGGRRRHQICASSCRQEVELSMEEDKRKWNSPWKKIKGIDFLLKDYAYDYQI